MKNISKIFNNLFNRNIQKLEYKGYIDRYKDNTLEGWAYLTSAPKTSLNIEIMIDGDVVTESHARIYRQDVSNVFQTNGKHGFSIKYVVKKEKLGIVTLRDKETKCIIPTNLFSLNYDLNILYENMFLKSLTDKYKDLVITKKSSISEIVYNQYITYQIQHCKETLEEAINNQDELPFECFIILLRIYISSSEFSNCLTLYQYIKNIYKDNENFNEVKILFITFLSPLWKEKIGYWPSPKDVHEFELLVIVFEGILSERDEIVLPMSIAIGSETELATFYAKSIKAGILFEHTTLKSMMNILIVDRNIYQMNEKVLMEQYNEQLPFVEMLWRSIQVQAKENLTNTLERMLLVSRNADHNNIIKREIISLFLNFISTLIRSEKLTSFSEVKKVYAVVEDIETGLDTETLLSILQIDVVKNDLSYLLNDTNQSYKNLMRLLERNIDYVDWNSYYASEIIFDYETSFVNVNKSDYSNTLIYQRFKSRNANLTDLLLILMDMVKHKDKHVVDMEKSIQLFSLLFVGICNIKLLSDKKIKMIKKYSDEFYHGLLQPYFNYAVKLRQNQLEADDVEIFESDILEEMNLISLAHINELDDSLKTVDKLNKNFSHLVKYDMLPDRVENSYDQNAVLIFVNDVNENEVLDYYCAMLKNFVLHNNAYYLFFEEYFYKLTLEKDLTLKKYSYTDVNIIKELVSIPYQRYLIVDDHFVIHHKSEELFVKNENSIFYTSDSEHFSYCIDRKTWLPFLELLDHTEIKMSKDLKAISFNKMTEAFISKLVHFTKYDTGIISAKAVPEKKVLHLSNFNIPVWEDIEVNETLQYLTHLYTNEKIITIESINTNDVALNLIKPFGIEEQKDDIACFLVQRNEFLRMEGFLEYYRALGVNKFYIIDNASNDGKTLEYLLEQKDVELYSTIQSYSQSKYGVKWAEVLIKTKRQGKWSLLLDADELLFFDSEYKSIHDICKYLDTVGCDSLYSPFVDMYSNTSISQTRYLKGKEILQTCQFYDRHFFTTFTANGGVMRNLPTYQGGVRSRAFGLDTVVLNKLPIFKYNSYMKMREGLHWIDNCNPMYGKSVLLHFKYIETFHEYVESEAKRGQHWNGASEYKQYLDFMHRNPDYTMYDAVLSSKFTSVDEFYKAQFKPLKISHFNREMEN